MSIEEQENLEEELRILNNANEKQELQIKNLKNEIEELTKENNRINKLYQEKCNESNKFENKFLLEHQRSGLYKATLEQYIRENNNGRF